MYVRICANIAERVMRANYMLIDFSYTLHRQKSEKYVLTSYGNYTLH